MRITPLMTSAGALGLVLASAACTAPPAQNQASSSVKTAQASGDAMKATVDFVKQVPDVKGKSIAFIAECATENEYCQTRWKGAQDAAASAGVKITLFNAGFAVNAQQSQVQDAVLRGFDGYVLSPVADAAGCANFDVLRKTGKPVVNINSPMCGNADYTDGTAGFVAMQTESYFTEHVENAFASCQEQCEAIAVGGFVGSDLFTRWEKAIQAAAKKYPKVKLVSDQPGNFDPAKALTVVQDALSANPKAQLVVSSWDDMTRGVEEAVRAAGKTPGKDVRIYSVAATSYGVAKVKDGSWNGTTVLLPREEGQYGVAQLTHAIATGQSTPGFAYLAQAPAVVNGPGTMFITAQNADSFKPEY